MHGDKSCGDTQNYKHPVIKMSHEGKMHRGEVWFNQRDRDGKLPDGIKNDPEKMKDVDYFLANQPKVEEPTKKAKVK